MKNLCALCMGLLAVFLAGCSGAEQTTSTPPPSEQRPRFVDRLQEMRHDRALRKFVDGAIYDLKGEYASAILEYQEALQNDPNPAIYFAISKDYSLLGKHPMAAQAAREAVRLDSANITYRENLAGVYLNAFQPDMAILEYEAIVKLDSNYINGWYGLARLYQSKRPLQAAEIYEKLLDRQGDDLELLMQSAETYNQLGRYEKAAEKYERMLQIEPGSKALQRQLAETLSKAGKIDDAVKLLEKMVEDEPNDLEVVAVLADVYLDRRDYEKALTLYKQLLKNAKANPELKVRVGIAYLGQVQRDSTLLPQAKRIFEDLQKQLPKDWRPYWYLGHIATIEKRDSLSAHYFEQVTRLAEGNADAWWYLGINLYERGEYKKLLDEMERAKRVVPKDYRVYFLTGLAYSKLDQQDKSIEALVRAYELNPKDINTLGTLALTYDGMQRYKDSDRLYEEALKVDSTSALILNNYGYSLAERGLQLERALRMATDAVKAEPENASYLDTLGWVFYKLKRYGDAEGYIEKAVATGKASPVVNEHLGDIYFQLGKKDQAKEMWQKALNMDSKNQALKDKILRGSL